MFEHVGRARLPTYFSKAHRLTRPGGLFLNHGIVNLSSRPAPLRVVQKALAQKTSFIQRYVFPDGELVPPAEVLRFAEAAGFETRDVESLREHYALTLRRWVRRLFGGASRGGGPHSRRADLQGVAPVHGRFRPRVRDRQDRRNPGSLQQEWRVRPQQPAAYPQDLYLPEMGR
jgi:hypothetical protein